MYYLDCVYVCTRILVYYLVIVVSSVDTLSMRGNLPILIVNTVYWIESNIKNAVPELFAERSAGMLSVSQLE